MTVFAALLAFGPGHAFDGEDAVDAARGFLERMGVPKGGAITALVDRKVPDRHGVYHHQWYVVIDQGKGLDYSIYVDRRGRVVFVSSSHFRGGGVPHSPADIKRGRWLMSRVPHAIPVVPDPIDTFQYRAVVHGRQFFNLNPSYGYRISFDKTGQLTGFSREDDLPPVSPRSPHIGRAAAEKTLTAAWRKLKRPAWPYPLRVDPDLGFYLRKGEKSARLVWRGTVRSLIGGHWSEFSDLNTFVDALTGAPFAADDRY